MGGLVYFKDTGEGEIRFLQPINGSGINLSREISISNNLVFVNSSQTGLNKSANVTLFNVLTTFTRPRVFRDNSFLCNNSTQPSCSNFTSLNAGTVIFNVSSWSDYRIASAAVTTCNSTSGCIFVRNNTASNKTIFDKFGNLDARGSVIESSVESPDGNDLIFKDSTGTTRAWVDEATGNLRLAGTVTKNTGVVCTPPASSFIIKNSSGSCMLYIDSSGNLVAKGEVGINSTI